MDHQHFHHLNDNREALTQWLKSINKYLIIGMVIGVASIGFSLATQSTRAWVNILLNHFYFLSLALSGGLILSIAYVAGGSWIAPIKRFAQAVSGYIPFAFVTMIILLFGIHSLYEWSHADVVAKDELLMKKAPFLNQTWFIIRQFIYFIPWILITRTLLNKSNMENAHGKDLLSKNYHLVKWACIYLIFFAFSYTLASYDYLMSLEPHWFSTIFAPYHFSGSFVNGLCIITLAAIILEKKGIIKHMTDDNFHDLAKFIFGFSTFWAYMWLSQFLLIWYANIPEETAFYHLRMNHSWEKLFYFNFFINWITPFFVLIARNAKRSRNVLAAVCVILICGHWLDIYLSTAPAVYHHHDMHGPSFGLIEIGMFIGFLSLFFKVFFWRLSKKELVAKNDPYFAESMALHQ